MTRQRGPGTCYIGPFSRMWRSNSETRDRPPPRVTSPDLSLFFGLCKFQERNIHIHTLYRLTSHLSDCKLIEPQLNGKVRNCTVSMQGSSVVFSSHFVVCFHLHPSLDCLSQKQEPDLPRFTYVIRRFYTDFTWFYMVNFEFIWKRHRFVLPRSYPGFT